MAEWWNDGLFGQASAPELRPVIHPVAAPSIPAFHYSIIPGRGGAGSEVECRKGPQKVEERHPEETDDEKEEPLALLTHAQAARARFHNGAQAKYENKAARQVLEEICGPASVHGQLTKG
jgi:hypothetical protein